MRGVLFPLDGRLRPRVLRARRRLSARVREAATTAREAGARRAPVELEHELHVLRRRRLAAARRQRVRQFSRRRLTTLVPPRQAAVFYYLPP